MPDRSTRPRGSRRTSTPTRFTSSSWWSSSRTPMESASPTTRPRSWTPLARSPTSWPRTFPRRRPDALDTLQSLLDELPADLAEQAFTHSSWVDRRTDSYERLAFLGDVVRSLAIPDHIYPRFADWGAGRLPPLRAPAVSPQACAAVAAVSGEELGRGQGKTKKAAEQEAASHALERVEEEWPPEPGGSA